MLKAVRASIICMLFSPAALSSGMDCGVYLKLDATCRCPGASNYLRNYAYPICERFSHAVGWTGRGLAWRDQTMLCLQTEAMALQKRSGRGCDCERLKVESFATHRACYNDQPITFCTLGKQDADLIFRTLQATELRSRPALMQAASIVGSCITRAFEFR